MPVTSATSVMGEAAARWVASPDVPLPIARGSASESPKSLEFRRVLSAVGEQIDRGEALVERALAGAQVMDAHQLIALQAGIYRYSEAVELSAKLVDRGSAALRAILQNPD